MYSYYSAFDTSIFCIVSFSFGSFTIMFCVTTSCIVVWVIFWYKVTLLYHIPRVNCRRVRVKISQKACSKGGLEGCRGHEDGSFWTKEEKGVHLGGGLQCFGASTVQGALDGQKPWKLSTQNCSYVKCILDQHYLSLLRFVNGSTEFQSKGRHVFLFVTEMEQFFHIQIVSQSFWTKELNKVYWRHCSLLTTWLLLGA